MLKVANTDIADIKLGNAGVSKVYHGNTQVWPSVWDGDLEALFRVALYSDYSDNIARTSNLIIQAHDVSAKYFDLKDFTFPLPDTSNPKSWFVCQGSEASTLVEIDSIIRVSTNVVRIWYGTTYAGTPNFSPGQKVELFNPFVNYSYIGDQVKLIDPYPSPSYPGTPAFNYLQAGGVFEKSDGTYTLLIPAIFGNHVARVVYRATSPDLENWTFDNSAVLHTNAIAWAINNSNCFTAGNPYRMQNGNLLHLVGANTNPEGRYSSGYWITNEDMNTVTPCLRLGINTSTFTPTTNCFPLSLTYYDGKYRLLVHFRADNNDLNKYNLEYTWEAPETDTNLMNFITGNTPDLNYTIVHQASNGQGYLHGKVDDCEYFKTDKGLYMFIGGEQEIASGWVTSNNREIGLAKLNESTGEWEHDVRSPLIINPIQLYHKYPQYADAWDHFGNWISPIIKGDHLYMFLSSGDDNPDYWLSGIKIPLT